MNKKELVLSILSLIGGVAVLFNGTSLFYKYYTISLELHSPISPIHLVIIITYLGIAIIYGAILMMLKNNIGKHMLLLSTIFLGVLMSMLFTIHVVLNEVILYFGTYYGLGIGFIFTLITSILKFGGKTIE